MNTSTLPSPTSTTGITPLRPSQRAQDALRAITLKRGYTCHAPGSVLIEYGRTRVLCTASVTPGVPRFLKERSPSQGWVTAEYSMLPGATQERTAREAARGKQSPRTQEIQRLIGRSLRSMVDLTCLGEHTVTLDCDVLQADGGTRTAAITGACLALVDAITTCMKKKKIKRPPLRYLIAAVSVGIYQGNPVLDLDYAEDQHAHTDMNLVINEHGNWIEIQGTAEHAPFTTAELDTMLRLGKIGTDHLIAQLKTQIDDHRAFITRY